MGLGTQYDVERKIGGLIYRNIFGLKIYHPKSFIGQIKRNSGVRRLVIQSFMEI